MQRGLGGAAFEPVPQSRDRELTLGPVRLTLIGFGLFGLCALCFVFGYAVGNRSAEPASLPNAGTPVIAQSANSPSKPSAGLTGVQPQQPPAPSDGTTNEPAAGAATSEIAQQGVASAAEPSVRSVLTSQPAPAQSAPTSAAVQPAIGAAPAGIMVQIAAVSQPEDADILVGALRKRGYAVSSRRDPADGLLHVQVGPFANRTDANAMRQKLLNDGYNAVVQP
jgi:cell division septation protein DedD